MYTWLALLRSRLRLGQCCVELHYGIVLGGGEFWPSFLRNLIFTNERAFPKQSHKVIRHNADPVFRSTDISAGQTSCLECLEAYSYFFVIYSLSRNNEHSTSSTCPTACKSHTFKVQILTTLLTFLFLTGSSKAEGIPDSFTSEVCRFACETALRCKWRITFNFSTISPVNMLPKFTCLFGVSRKCCKYTSVSIFFDRDLYSWNDTCFFVYSREKCSRLLPRPLCACSQRSLR